MVRVSERHRRRGIIICQAKKWSLPPNVQTEVTHSKSTYDKFPRSIRNMILSSGITCSILAQEHTLSTHLALLVAAFARVSFNPGFMCRCTKESNVDPAEVSQNGGILLANLHQSSRSTLS